MSSIESIPGANAHIPPPSRIDGYQSLSQSLEQRRVSSDTRESQQDLRQRMTPTLSAGEERTLLDKTKDIAVNLFNAFRNEMREALHHIGVQGETAADLIRDVSEAFTNAVREGSSFSFGMIATAYKETLVQTGTSVSHALEFSANALSIEYNHATGKLTADTGKLEIDAVRAIKSDNLPAEANALFDFTDGDGPPTLSTLFDRVQQYLTINGFMDEESEDGGKGVALQLPGTDRNAYDAVLINNEQAEAAEAAEDEENKEATKPFETLLADKPSSDAIRIQAVEEFTNARRETITRMTLDLVVRVHIGKDDTDPETTRAQNSTNETFEITV